MTTLTSPSIYGALLIFVFGCSLESTQLISPAQANSGEPHLSLTHQGQPLLSWLETNAQQSTLKFSILKDDLWSSPTIVAEGADWFVNWADFPSVEAFADDQFVAHWLVKKPGNAYSYDIAISQSNNEGKTWSSPQTPHQDGIAAEHGFVTLFPERKDNQPLTAALWLDGRNPKTGTALRSTTIPQPGEDPLEEIVVDALVCDCCQTDVAISDLGPVAVYRNRTVGEIRDIYVTRKLDSGWSDPYPLARDNWEIAGCPVNGPAITARGNQVAVAWYTEAHKEPKVQIAISTDSGQSFQSPLVISGEKPLGRVDIAYIESGELAIIWLEAADANAALSLRRYSLSNTLSPTKVIATTSAARPSGFPQIVSYENGLLVAWVDVTENGRRVLTQRVNP